jgi:hypothetical protein
VTLTVTGNGITSNDENVTISGNATAGYVVTVRNWLTVDIKVKSGLLDPMINQRTFVYYATYKLNGKKYDLNRKKLNDGDTPAQFALTAYSTSDGSVDNAQVPKTISIPVGATELTIWEDTTKETVAPDTIGTTYDTYVQYKSTPWVQANTYIYSVAIATTHENDEITFKNVKKTVKIKVKKVMETEEKTDVFNFTATLLYGNMPIKGYPIYDRYNTPNNLDDDDKTDANLGTYGFTLGHNGEIILSVPVGVRVLLQEASAVGHTDDSAYMDLYATTVEVLKASDSSTYTGTTLFDEDTRLFEIVAAPSTNLNVTFTNAEGSKEVYFMKLDGYGNALAGADFALYDTYAHAHNHGTTGLVDIKVNSTKVKKVTSKATLDTTTHVDATTHEPIPFNVSFKVKFGVYYMIESNQVTGYKKNENIYRVVVGRKGTIVQTIQLPTDKEFIINLCEDATTVKTDPDIPKYGIININEHKRNVVLKKVNGSDNDKAISGAVLNVYYVDKTKMELTTANLDASDNFGEFFA